MLIPVCGRVNRSDIEAFGLVGVGEPSIDERNSTHNDQKNSNHRDWFHMLRDCG